MGDEEDGDGVNDDGENGAKPCVAGATDAAKRAAASAALRPGSSSGDGTMSARAVTISKLSAYVMLLGKIDAIGKGIEGYDPKFEKRIRLSEVRSILEGGADGTHIDWKPVQ